MPDTHDWGYNAAIKEKKKGRAKGGRIVGVKKGWGGVGNRIIRKIKEGVIMTEIKEKGDFTMIMSIYNRNDGRRWEKE